MVIRVDGGYINASEITYVSKVYCCDSQCGEYRFRVETAHGERSYGLTGLSLYRGATKFSDLPKEVRGLYEAEAERRLEAARVAVASRWAQVQGFASIPEIDLERSTVELAVLADIDKEKRRNYDNA